MVSRKLVDATAENVLDAVSPPGETTSRPEYHAAITAAEANQNELSVTSPEETWAATR
jgi:hypothetical protein